MATAKPPSPQRPLMQTNVKPASPMLAPEQRPSKPPSPLRPKNAPKTPISHPQRRRRFQSRLSRRPQRRRRFQSKLGRHPQRRRRFQSRLSRHPQRRQRFQTTGPAGLQGQAAVPVGGGGAWPGFETTHRSATRLHWCGGRRRVRRARAGFEIDHSEPLGSRVAISRAAGPDGARNTRGAASNTINDAGRRPPAHTAAGPSGARNTSGATSNTTAAPTTQRNEAATGFPATASSRSRSAVHNSATSNQAVMST